MSRIANVIDNVKAFFFFLFYPAGCLSWIFHHRLKNNWHFLVLFGYGLLTALYALASIVHGLIPYYTNSSWRMELWCYGSAYVIGLIGYGISSWKKAKSLENPERQRRKEKSAVT